MKTVYKYQLNNPERVTKIMLPPGSKILHAAFLRGFYVWVELDLGVKETELFRLRLMATGSATFGRYINTFFAPCDEVYHLYVLEES